jgi:hypothetical protein
MVGYGDIVYTFIIVIYVFFICAQDPNTFQNENKEDL